MGAVRMGMLLAACACLLAGCYEDEAVITINRDGSGTIHQTFLLSERLIVASSEGAPTGSVPPVTREGLLEDIGSAFTVTSMTVDERADGSRWIELDGTFDSPEQFFLSDFCRDRLSLRLVPTSEGKAVLQCDIQLSPGEVSLVQLYGMAKGLHVKRTIHLPAAIEQTNGTRGVDNRTVSWTVDLRDKDGLARTRAFVEGPDQGKGVAVFDAAALSFALPLQEPTSPEPTGAEPPADSALRAQIAWVSVQKAVALGDEDIADRAYTEVGVELTREDTSASLRYERPVWISAFDDTGADLIDDTSAGYSGQIYAGRPSALVKLKAKAPSPGARRLVNMRGYVEVRAETLTETVTLKNIGNLAGKETTGNATLDDLGFKILATSGNTLSIAIEGGRTTIESLELSTENGEPLSSSGGMGSGDRYSFTFREPIPATATCKLTVIVAETMVKVPFSLDEVALP